MERWELDDGKVKKIHPSIYIHSSIHSSIHLWKTSIYLLRKGAIKGGCFVGLGYQGKDIVFRFIIEYLY